MRDSEKMKPNALASQREERDERSQLLEEEFIDMRLGLVFDFGRAKWQRYQIEFLLRASSTYAVEHELVNIAFILIFLEQTLKRN